MILTANLNGTQVYNGYINNFSYATTSLGIWEFRIEARENSYGYCDFNFVYQGWQKDFLEYDMRGFSDKENVSNTVFIDELPPEPVTESCIKINEVYYYPGIREGANGFENNPNDEWIELSNACDHEVNIKNWYLNNEDNSELINQNYIIETLVLYWLVNSLVGVWQQVIINRKFAPVAVPGGPAVPEKTKQGSNDSAAASRGDGGQRGRSGGKSADRVGGKAR